MGKLLLALLMITAADLNAMAQATDNVPGPIAADSQQVSPSPSMPTISANAPATPTRPDCTEQRPATTSVTDLLSRLVRVSTLAKGLYCPSPSVPDPSPAQEFHP